MCQLKRYKDLKLKAFRNPFNRRYYTHNQYVEYMDKIVQDKDKRKTIIYTRVTTNGQENDLKSQSEFLNNMLIHKV